MSIFSTAAGLAARAWQWTRDGQAPDFLDRLIAYLAAGSVALCLLGGLLLYLRNGATEQVQSYNATDADRAVEQRAQRQAIEELIIREQNQNLPAAATKPNRPPKAPSTAQRGSPRGVAAAPASPRSDDVLSSEPVPVLAHSLSVTNYVADQIARLNIELRNLSSRVAVMEYHAEQLRERSWYEWCGQAATLLGATGGVLAAILALLKWIWRGVALFLALRNPASTASRKSARARRAATDATVAARRRSRQSP